MKCKHCQKRFTSRHGLLTHLGQVEPCRTKNRDEKLKRMSPDSFVICSICGVRKRRLMNHLIKIHGVKTSDYSGELMCKEDREETGKHLGKMRKALWGTEKFRKVHSSVAVRKKISNSVKAHFAENPEARELLSRKACEREFAPSRFKRGYYFSTKMNKKFWYQSSFELATMKRLDADNRVLSWKKNNALKIEYLVPDDIAKHLYVPDFEVKTRQGKFLLETKQFPDKRLLFKLIGLDKFCRKNGLQFALARSLKQLSFVITNQLHYAQNMCANGRRWTEIQGCSLR